MAWPPALLPVDRNNDMPQSDNHPLDHNGLGLAFNDITARIKGDVAARKQTTTGGSLKHGTWTRCSTGATVDFTTGEKIRGDTTSIISDIGGFFLVFCYVYWSTSSGTGRRIVGISTSTSTVPNANHEAVTAGMTAAQAQQVCIPFYSAGSCRFNLWAYQDSGATMTLSARNVVVVRLTPQF